MDLRDYTSSPSVVLNNCYPETTGLIYKATTGAESRSASLVAELLSQAERNTILDQHSNWQMSFSYTVQ